MTVHSIRSAKPRADSHAVLNWAQPAPLQATDRTTARRPPVKSAAWQPAKSSASKPFIKFIPGPWTAELLMLANPGMSAHEAYRLAGVIHRSHEAAARKKKAAAARADKEAPAVVEGACA